MLGTHNHSAAVNGLTLIKPESIKVNETITERPMNKENLKHKETHSHAHLEDIDDDLKELQGKGMRSHSKIGPMTRVSPVFAIRKDEIV